MRQLLRDVWRGLPYVLSSIVVVIVRLPRQARQWHSSIQPIEALRPRPRPGTVLPTVSAPARRGEFDPVVTAWELELTDRAATYPWGR